MNYEFLLSLVKVSVATSVFLALLTLFKFKNANPAQKTLSYLIFIGTLTEVTTFMLAQYKINNLPFLHLYTILEFLLLTRIFQQNIKSGFPSIGFRGIQLFIVSFAFWYAFLWKSLWVHNDLVRFMAGIFIMFYCVLFFYDTIKKLNITHLEKSPIFWISTGVLLYYLTNFVFFLFTNNEILVLMEQRTSLMLWGIYIMMNIVKYIFFGIAIQIKSNDAR